MTERRAVRLLVVEDVPELAQYMRTSLVGRTDTEILGFVPDGARALAEIDRLRPDVAIVDALLRGKVRPIEILARLHELGIPGVVVTIPKTTVPVDPERGIAAVVTMPFSAGDLNEALTAALESAASAGHGGPGRIVAVYGPKGGIGRSTVAIGLAAAAVDAGTRTVLVDGCLQFGDLRTMLHVPDAPSILNLPTDVIDDEALGIALQAHSAGFDLLLAPPRVEQAEMVSVRDIAKLLPALAERYPLTVVDLPGALSDTTLAFLDAADTVLLVIGEDAAALSSAAQILATFRALGYPGKKIRIVVNGAGPVDPAAAVEAALGVPVTHSISFDPLLARRAAGEGTAFGRVEADAEASRDLAALAEALVGRPGVGAGS